MVKRRTMTRPEADNSPYKIIMPRLVRGIHVLFARREKLVDGPTKSGHDD
jgi:hypothetical protein